jgi:hypothetical protein
MYLKAGSIALLPAFFLSAPVSTNTPMTSRPGAPPEQLKMYRAFRLPAENDRLVLFFPMLIKQVTAESYNPLHMVFLWGIIRGHFENYK